MNFVVSLLQIFLYTTLIIRKFMLAYFVNFLDYLLIANYSLFPDY